MRGVGMMGEREVYRWLFFLALIVIAAAAGVLLFKLHRRRCTHCRRITRPGKFTTPESPPARLCGSCRDLWEQQQLAAAEKLKLKQSNEARAAEAIARMREEALAEARIGAVQTASEKYEYIPDPPPPPPWNPKPRACPPTPSPVRAPAQCDICGTPFKRKYSAFTSQFHGVQFICPHCRRTLKRKKYEDADSYVVNPPYERTGFIYEVHCVQHDGSKVVHNIWANMPKDAQAIAESQNWHVVSVLVSRSGADAEFIPLRNGARYVPF